MEASEPGGSGLEGKGLESLWIVTGSRPHSKAEDSRVECLCLRVTEARDNRLTLQQWSVHTQQGNTAMGLSPPVGVWGGGEECDWEGSR